MKQSPIASTRPQAPTQSRRSLVRSAFVLAVTATGYDWISAVTPRAFAQQSDARAALERFYLDVATYNYRDAYNLLGPVMQQRQSLEAFTDGYADTAYVQVVVSSSKMAQNGTILDTVITAWHNDRSIHAYGGTYTLELQDGGWKIAGASIREILAPDVPPLMRFSDIAISHGQQSAGTGHRYFELLFTNTSQSMIEAAGVPHLTLLDASQDVVIESASAETQPITAVELAPGDTASVLFEWSNWCDSPPESPLSLRIAIPGDSNRQTIPFLENPRTYEAPPCIGNAGPSIFTCRAFTSQAQSSYRDKRSL